MQSINSLQSTSSILLKPSKQPVVAKNKANPTDNEPQHSRDSKQSERIQVNSALLTILHDQPTSAHQQTSTGYDNPNKQHQFAVNSYQQVGALAQRDKIQQLFGVDLFA